MNYKKEFSHPQKAEGLLEAIRRIPLSFSVNLMEVCGTHTHAVAQFGIRQQLPQKVRLLSGPGCPVCVTPNPYLDKAIEISRREGVIITTFGDMFRVPGSYSSLQIEKSKGRDIRMVYSPRDALEIAKKNPHKKVIFLGVGFETTAPTIASAVLSAKESGIKNFYILSGFKTLPNALKVLAESHDLNLHGLICPGHLSIITGTHFYEFMVEKYRIPCVITGFTPLDILDGIRRLLIQISKGESRVENAYGRVVRDEGNPKALSIMEKVFEPIDSEWRGIGVIPSSGLKLKKEYIELEAETLFPPVDNKGFPTDYLLPSNPLKYPCICGQILRGVKIPADCPSFRKNCTPETPIGACMVSSEGTCSAYYRYII